MDKHLLRIVKSWAMGSHKDCKHCGKKVTLADFYEMVDGEWEIRVVNEKPTMLFCGTEGCQSMWWKCPFCGEDLR